MQRAEQSKRVFQKIEHIRNPERQGGLAHLLVPEDPQHLKSAFVPKNKSTTS